MNKGAERFDVSTEELDALVEQARPALDEAGYQKLKAAVRTLSVMTTMIESPDTTLQSLRTMFGQGQTEKTVSVLKRAGIPTEKPPAPPKPKAPGHGRHGAKAYRGADKVQVAHSSLKIRRPMPGMSARQSLRPMRTGSAGAFDWTGSYRSHGL